MRLAAMLACALWATSAAAHDEWQWEDTSLRSAELAGTGWQLTQAVGLARPGEVEKLITFWTGTLDGRLVIVRCVAVVVFGGFNDQETCQLPVNPE